MGALSITLSGCILRKFPEEDRFQALQAFCGTQGTVTFRQRLAHKRPGMQVALDLFDDAELVLESSNQGQSWFVKEARLLKRRTEIGTHYEALEKAAALTALVARNAVPEEGREKVAELLRTALDALAGGARPEVVWVKSLYCFARDEGYPVQQHWRQELPTTLREAASVLLRTPLAALDEASLPKEIALQLGRRLETYLRGHAELVFE